MTDGAQYLLPGGGPAGAAESFADRLGAAADPARTIERTYYDTFDGRLRAAGLTLVQCDGALRLDGDGALAERRTAPERILVGDLPPGPLHDALAGLVDVRALIPTARVRSRERALRVLDDERKTVVRLRIESPSLVRGGRVRTALRPRVHVLGVRGYDRALQRRAAHAGGRARAGARRPRRSTTRRWSPPAATRRASRRSRACRSSADGPPPRRPRPS